MLEFLTSPSAPGKYHTVIRQQMLFPHSLSIRHLHHDARRASYHAAETYHTEGDIPRFISRPLQRVAGGIRLSLVVFGVIALDHAYLQRSDKETQQRALREQFDVPGGMLFLYVRDSCADFVEVITPYLTRRPRGGRAFVRRDESEILQLVVMRSGSVLMGLVSDGEYLDMVRSIKFERFQLDRCAVVRDCGGCADHAVPGLCEAVGAGTDAWKVYQGQRVNGRNESCTVERVALVVPGLKGISVEV
ncbi:hypothetical protein CFD26_107565 [Aspergillus turcosus]|uniref:Uncharacterized protein n=1 Tax=Aspergillus turcosus TaxID=1245748 RepID=A0A421D9G0_9EURO|nr:hypothetical protein CFD26_107565 [Aspergillus turcosus]